MSTLSVIFLIALTLRAAWGIVAIARAEDTTALSLPDEQQYWQIAQSLHAGTGLRDELGFRATRMPLYPGVLSLFADTENGVVAAKVLHWIVGALGAVLVAGLGTAIFGHGTGRLAGVLYALDPFLIFTSSLLLTETFFLCSLAGLWWVTWPLVYSEAPQAKTSRWSAVGLLACLTVYIRVSSVGMILALCLFAVIRHRLRRRTLLGAMAALAVVVVGMFPWAMRNRAVTGKWCWLTNRGGISLYDGVGPQADGSSDLGDIKQMDAVRGLIETDWNRYFLQRSIEAIREDPARILRLAAVKMRRFWNPFPNIDTHQSPAVRFVSAGWMIPLYLCTAGAIVWRLARNGARDLPVLIFLLLPAVYLSLLHSVFVGSVRYRLGATPMMEILAAWFLVALYRRLWGKSDAEVE